MKASTYYKMYSLTFASAILTSMLLAPIAASATVLFSDNFDTNSSALWTVNVAPATNAAQQDAVFAYDYSAMGIPPAPGSTNTLGLRLRSNIPGSAAAPVTTRPTGVASGLSVSPTGQNFGTNYHVTFYTWVNFNGAANVQGLMDNANSEGGTHNILFAVGTSGTVPLVVNNTALASGASMDGIAFATTGDGGITADYRVYPKSGTISATNSGYYAAGSAANLAFYYTNLPSLAPHSAPVIQQSLSTAEYGGDATNTQAGQTQIGAFGFAWHKVDVIKIKNNVRWFIDNTFIAGGDFTSVGALGGSNIAIGDSDVNSTTTRHPSLLFSLIDNLVVTDVPAPTLQSTQVGATLKLSWPDETTGGAVLQSTTNLTAPASFTPVVATLTTNSGIVSVTVPTTNSASYFRLQQ